MVLSGVGLQEIATKTAHARSFTVILNGNNAHAPIFVAFFRRLFVEILQTAVVRCCQDLQFTDAGAGV